MINHLIKSLIDVAKTSKMNSRHAAAIVYNKRIIATATNTVIENDFILNILKTSQKWDKKEFIENKSTSFSNLFINYKNGCKCKTLNQINDINTIKRRIEKNGALAKHAEINVIEKYKKICKNKGVKKLSFNKLKLFVIRIDKKDNIVESKPCSHCKSEMILEGFKNVIYSDNVGNLIKGSLFLLITKNSFDNRSKLFVLELLKEMTNFYSKKRIKRKDKIYL